MSISAITPPHSAESEEYLLSACLIDGKDVVAKCIARRLKAPAFFVPANQIIYSRIVAMFIEGKDINLAVLAEELKTARLIDSVGSYSYLTQISQLVPTTLNVDYFIKRIHDLSMLRDIFSKAVHVAQSIQEYSGEDICEFIAPLETSIAALRNGVNTERRDRGIGEFVIPPDSDPSTLLGDRYVCRGHAAMIVGGSGMGKSTIAYQASVAWALGLPFLGIAVTNEKGYLISVHFQSEDEDGDIAEVRECVFQEMKLTKEQRELVNKRVIIITEKVLRGSEFIADMSVTATRLKADIVWINPLHAFLDGDIKDSKTVGDFCRGGLNGANRDSRWAYMIVHHTPKPTKPTGSSDPKEREWNEIMYEGAGSADLVNFCRVVQVLKATKDEGLFNLYLAKRGKKADVHVEKISESGTEYLELVTKIPCQHSRNKITLPGRDKPINVMFWEGRAADPTPAKSNNPGRPKKHDFCDGDFLEMFPSSDSDPEDSGIIIRMAVSRRQMGSKTTIHRHKTRLIESGHLKPFADNGIRRTALGDAVVREYLEQRE